MLSASNRDAAALGVAAVDARQTVMAPLASEVFSLSRVNVTSSIASFAMPATAAGIAFQMKSTVAAPNNTLRVSFGAATDPVILGDISLATANAAGGTFYVPVPASMRNRTLPLTFTIVSGSANTQAVVEISNIADTGDLSGLAKDRSTELTLGMNAFGSLADDLFYLDSFQQLLPLYSGGVQQRVGNLIDIKGTLKALITTPVNQFLASNGNPNTTSLKTVLQGLTIAGQTVTITGLTVTTTDTQVRIALTATAKRTVTGLTPDLTDADTSTGLAIKDAATVSATSTITVGLSFGLNIASGAAAPGSFFLSMNKLSATLSSAATGLNLAGSVGLLGASVKNGTFKLDVALNTPATGPNLNRDLSRGDLSAQTPASLLGLTEAGTLATNLPVTAQLASTVTAFTANLKIDDANIFDTTAPVITATGFDALAAFRELDSKDVFAMFEKLSGWMSVAGNSTWMHAPIPFTSGKTLADAIDLGKGFADKVLMPISQALTVDNQSTTGPAFDTFQTLLSKLSVTSGVKFDSATKSVTFPIKFSLDLTGSPISVPVSFNMPLGNLGGIASSASLVITPKLDAIFTLGFDLRSEGDKLTIDGNTTLASLNDGKGVAPAGDAMALEIDLSDGTILKVSLAGATTLGAVISKINATAGAAGKLTASIDTVRKTLLLIDKTGGKGTFKVVPTGTSLIAAGLGLLGRWVNESSTTKTITGSPLYNDDLSNHIFLSADSTATPANLSGSFGLSATGINANASLGFAGITITNGKVTGSTAFKLTLKDLTGGDGRITVKELSSSFSDIASSATATASASVNLDLPVALQPTGLVATGSSLKIAWNDPALGVADGTDATGKPLSTNSTATFTYPSIDFQSLAGVAESAIESGLAGLSKFLTGPGAFKALNTKLPLINTSVGDMLGLSTEFDNFTSELTKSTPTTLTDLKTKLQSAFKVVGSVVTLSWDSTLKAIKISFKFGKTVSSTNALNINLNGGNSLVGAGASGSVASTLIANVQLDFGLDLSTPTSPKPFIYDTSKITVGTSLKASTVSFSGNIGPVGVYIKDSASQKAVAYLTTDGTAAGAPATITISLAKGTNGRYLLSDSTILNVATAALAGKATATLPVYFPTPTVLLSKPISVNINLATGVSTITTPFDSGLPTVDLSKDLDAMRSSFLDGMKRLKATLLGQISGVKLPLIGSKLTESLNFIDKVQDAIDTQMKTKTGDLSLATMQTAVSDAIKALISSLKLSSTSSVSTAVTSDGVELKMKLHRDVQVETNALGFDLGIPGLGLSLTTNLGFSAGFDFNLGFGISKTNGFYLLADPTQDEVKLTVSADATTFDASGTLGFFKVRALKISGQDIRASAAIAFNLKDPSGSDNRVTISDLTSNSYSSLVTSAFANDQKGRASGMDVNLGLNVGFSTPTAPSLGTNLHLGWIFSQAAGSTPSLAGTLNVKFENVSLQMGELFKNTIGPVLDNIQNVLKPIEPVIDILTTRLPVLSDLMKRDVTLADLAVLFGKGGADVAKFVSVVKRIGELQSILATLQATNAINLGSFAFTLSTVNDKLGNVDLSKATTTAAPTPPLAQAQGKQTEFFSASSSATATKNGGLTFPIFENPSTAFGLLLGKDVDLMQFDTPTLDLSFLYKQVFPILGPLSAQLTGQLGAKIHFIFGLDTYPLTHSSASVLDGFYVLTHEKSGAIAPQLQLYGSIKAGAELNLGIASAGAEGGLFANVDFALNDPNNDGKVRLAELVGNLKKGPSYIFDISGALTAGLDVYAEVDLGFYTDRWEYQLAHITLLNFDTRPAAAPVIPFNPGTVNAAGLLTLTSTTDDDSYHIVAGANPGDIIIQTRGENYPRSGVKSISFSGGNGNDDVAFDAGVTLIAGVAVPVTLKGDAGDDTFVAGNMATRLEGGNGNDQLSGTTAIVTALGGAGNDTLLGSPLADSLDGEADDDYIQASDGNDTVSGGVGKDKIFAGAGNDKVDAGDGDDTSYGDLGDDTITAGNGLDNLDGGDGNDSLTGGALILGDAGDDTLTTTVTNPTLVGGAGNDKITATAGNVTAYGDDSIAGSTGNDSITTGSGNDTIIAGAGQDTVGAGDGANKILAGDQELDDTTTEANTITSGLGNDSIYGSAGADKITAGDGNNIVSSGAGNDVITTGVGDDLIDAGAGDDNVDAGKGNDGVEGGDGNDTLKGGVGGDVVNGGRGNDSLIGGPLSLAVGELDNDTVTGGPGNDLVAGNIGDDLLIGDLGPVSSPDATGGTTSGVDAFGNDTILGGSGFDTIYGQGGNDIISGNDAIDYLYGGPGNDSLYGGNDNDQLFGGDGKDDESGGRGADILNFDINSTYVDVSNDTWRGFGGNGPYLDAANVIQNLTDTVTVDDNATDALLIVGTTSADNIKLTTPATDNPGTPGIDETKQIRLTFNGVGPLSGTWLDSSGKPLMRQIRVNTGDGSDVIDMFGLNVSAWPAAGGNQFVTLVDSGAGDDTVYGTNGRDRVYAGPGSDKVQAYDGDDQIWGDAPGGGDQKSHTNLLFGGTGNDDIIGGRGSNLMYAWSYNPVATASKPAFGVFLPNGAPEDTGLDRMLGNRNNDSLYLGTGVAFAYGYGGDDTYYRSDGSTFETAAGLTGEQTWKDIAKKNGRVWYIPTSDVADDVTVTHSATEGDVVQYTPVAYDDAGVPHYADTQFLHFTQDTGTSSGQFGNAGVASTVAALTGATAAGAQDFDIILIDTFGDSDTVTIDPTVETSVWVDGGTGDDNISWAIKNAATAPSISTDAAEGSTRNDGNGSATDLGTISSSVWHTGLSIYKPGTGSAAIDTDWYKFQVDHNIVSGESLAVQSLSAGDGMVIELYDNFVQRLDVSFALQRDALNPSRWVMDLAGLGLVPGQTFYLKIMSNNGSTSTPRPTIYSIALNMNGVDATTKTPITWSNNRDPSERRDIFVGGEGNDTLLGGAGPDWIFGGVGNDLISGGGDSQQDDLLFGEDGDDVFQLTPGALPTGTSIGTFVTGDLFDGGDGTNSLLYEGQVDRRGSAGTAPDFAALRYGEVRDEQGNLIDSLYQLTALVQGFTSANVPTGYMKSGSTYVQWYQSFNVVNVGHMDILLAEGNDVFIADGSSPKDSGGVAYLGDGQTYRVDRNTPITSMAIDCGFGNDSVASGGTDDTITDIAGQNTLAGGKGSDWVTGGRDKDILAGEDVLTLKVNPYSQGSSDQDTVGGGLYESAGDTFFGGSGNDTINIGAFAGLAYEPLNGTINGSPGNDSLVGGDGADFINGYAGNDTIEGGGGVDTLCGGTGGDEVYGAYFYDVPIEQSDIADGGNFIYGGDNIDIASDSSRDTLAGAGSADVIFGGNGSDRIIGQSGNDWLVAGSSYPGPGADWNDANSYDTAGGGASPTRDTIYGGDGNDTIFDAGGNDTLFGEDGNDVIFAQLGSDIVSAGNGSDWVGSWLGVGSDLLDDATTKDTIDLGPKDGGSDTVGYSNLDNFFGGGTNVIVARKGFVAVPFLAYPIIAFSTQAILDTPAKAAQPAAQPPSTLSSDDETLRVFDLLYSQPARD